MNHSKLILLIVGLAVLVSLNTISFAYAENFQVIEECENNVVTLTISDSEGPVSNSSIHIYADLAMTKYEGKVITDENGQAEIPLTDKTYLARISKGGYNDTSHVLSCAQELREQSMEIFVTRSSNIGTQTDSETGLTVIDLGTLFGIAGSGTMPDYIVADKDGREFAILPSAFISPASAHGEWQISQSFFSEYQNTGKYTLHLLTNDEETFVFEFFVRQINLSPIPQIADPNTLFVPDPKVTLITWEETGMTDRWSTTVRLCPGSVGITEPTVMFDTDMEQIIHVWSKRISPGSCGEDFFEVKANNPKSIKVEIGTFKQTDEAITGIQQEVEKLREEVVELKERLEKKDAILMEQIKVIQQLASSISNTIFEPISKFLGFT